MKIRRASRLSTRLAYGVGQAAEGIKVAALGGLLFFYYHQVLGLSSLATAVALFFGMLGDTIGGIVAGSISDRLKHRRGQRHPLMLAATLPTCLALVALFWPPVDRSSETLLFFWLAGWVLVCRVGMTFFRVPHFALGADMADTPNAKTTNVAFRQFFHVLGGILVFWIARELMVPTPEFPIAQTNPEHYPLLSLICAVSALLAMLIATVGTYGVALATVKPNESSDAGHGSLTRLAMDFRHTLRPRAFRQLVICIGAFAIAAGIQRATELYLASYFWGLATPRAMLLPIATLVGSLVGIVFWTLISRRIEKRSCYIGGVLTYAIVAIALPAANVLGVLPPTEADAFAMIVIGGTVLAGLLAAAPTVLVGAMIADVIDADERNSGRRRAASFFATAAFVAKPALALSLLLAGALLAGAGVSSDELPSQNVSTILGLAVGSTITFFAVVAALLMRNFNPNASV